LTVDWKKQSKSSFKWNNVTKIRNLSWIKRRPSTS
jgi:hypothetical protein